MWEKYANKSAEDIAEGIARAVFNLNRSDQLTHELYKSFFGNPLAQEKFLKLCQKAKRRLPPGHRKLSRMIVKKRKKKLPPKRSQK